MRLSKLKDNHPRKVIESLISVCRITLTLSGYLAHSIDMTSLVSSWRTWINPLTISVPNLVPAVEQWTGWKERHEAK
jgi:hypothetical protein